jgi:REP element-mobilizing transposase RayT
MILFGYVIMSNHIHMIIQSQEATLSDLIEISKIYSRNQFWENSK